MSEFKFDEPLNKSTISQFEIYLISSIPVVLEQEGVSGLTNYCDDFRNLCQSILTPTEFAQANIRNDKLGKLDQLIDNILNLKDAIRKKIQDDSLEIPVDNIQKVVDRMNKAQDELSRLKDIAPDPGDNKKKLIASFQSRYKTLNENECIELANAAFAEAVEHPNEIPNIVSLLTDSDHPLPPNLAIEQIRPVVDYIRDHNPLVGLVHEAIKTEIEKAGIPLTEESTNNILALHYSKIGKEPSFLVAALGGIVSEDLGGKSLPLKPADIQALGEILGSDFSLSAREKAATYLENQGADPVDASQLVGEITNRINKAIEENTRVSDADIVKAISATYSAPTVPSTAPASVSVESPADYLAAKLAIETKIPEADRPAAIVVLDTQVSQGKPIVISDPAANSEYTKLRAQSQVATPLDHQATLFYQTAKSADSEPDATIKINTLLTALGYTPEEVSKNTPLIVQRSRTTDQPTSVQVIKESLTETITTKPQETLTSGSAIRQAVISSLVRAGVSVAVLSDQTLAPILVEVETLQNQGNFSEARNIIEKKVIPIVTKLSPTTTTPNITTLVLENVDTVHGYFSSSSPVLRASIATHLAAANIPTSVMISPEVTSTIREAETLMAAKEYSAASMAITTKLVPALTKLGISLDQTQTQNLASLPLLDSITQTPTASPALANRIVEAARANNVVEVVKLLQLSGQSPDVVVTTTPRLVAAVKSAGANNETATSLVNNLLTQAPTQSAASRTFHSDVTSLFTMAGIPSSVTTAETIAKPLAAAGQAVASGDFAKAQEIIEEKLLPNIRGKGGKLTSTQEAIFTQLPFSISTQSTTPFHSAIANNLVAAGITPKILVASSVVSAIKEAETAFVRGDTIRASAILSNEVVPTITKAGGQLSATQTKALSSLPNLLPSSNLDQASLTISPQVSVSLIGAAREGEGDSKKVATLLQQSGLSPDMLPTSTSRLITEIRNAGNDITAADVAVTKFIAQTPLNSSVTRSFHGQTAAMLASIGISDKVLTNKEVATSIAAAGKAISSGNFTKAEEIMANEVLPSLTKAKVTLTPLQESSLINLPKSISNQIQPKLSLAPNQIDSFVLNRQAETLFEIAKSNNLEKTIGTLKRQGVDEPRAKILAPILIEKSQISDKSIAIASLVNELSQAAPVSLPYLAARSSLQSIVDPEKRADAIKQLESYPNKKQINEAALLRIISDAKVANDGSYSKVLGSFLQIKTSAEAAVFARTQPIDRDMATQFVKDFRSAKSPEEAIQKAAIVIANNSHAAPDSPVTLAQAAATYAAFKENHPDLPSLKIDPVVINSFKNQTASEIFTNLEPHTQTLTPAQRQSLAVDLNAAFKNNQDPQQAFTNYIKPINADLRAQQAIMVASSIPIIASPFTREDKVLFATTAAIQSLGLNTFDTKTIKAIAEIKSSLSPEKAEAEITKLLDKHPLPIGTTPVEITKKLTISINEHLDSQSQSLSQVVDKVLASSKVDIGTKQQIVGVLSSRLSVEEQDKKLTQLLSENATGANVPKLRNQLIDESKRLSSPQLFTPEQLSELATIANDKRLTPEQRKTDLTTKLQSYGYSASASAHTATQIPTNGKPINMEQIIRSANEQKPSNSLGKIASGDQVFSRQEIILNSLKRSGLSESTAQAFVADAAVLKTLTLGMTTTDRYLVLQELATKNYGQDTSRLPLNMPKIDKALTLAKATPSNPESINNLLINYTQFSAPTQKAIDRYFQNDTNFKSALTGLLGSKDLADKFMENGLHKSVYLIADQATKTDKLLKEKNINFDSHFRNSFDLHLQYLESQGVLKEADLKHLKTLRAKLQDPRSNLESFKNLFQMPLSEFKLNHDPQTNRPIFQVSPNHLKDTFTNSNGQPTSFFKYITDPLTYKTKLTQTFNQLNTIRIAFSHPDLKAIAQNLLSPKNYTQFIKDFALRKISFNPLTSFVGDRTALGKNSAIYKVGAALYPKLVATKLGGAILKPLAALATKASALVGAVATKIAAKLGIQALGSFVPGVGNFVAFLLGVVLDFVAKIWAKYKTDIEDTAKGAGVAVANGVGGLGTGLGDGLGTLAATIFTIIGTIITATITAILTPLIVALLGIPIAMAFFLFIITNSSYVTPPTAFTIGTGPGGEPAVVLPPDPTGNFPRCWPFRSSDRPSLKITRGPGPGHNGWGPTGYNAIDIDVPNILPYDIPVYASHNGRVEVRANMEGYGNTVILHGFGFFTLYAHLDQISVTDGQVGRGTQLGIAGASGSLANGSHLHYEYVPYNNPNIPSIDSIVPGYNPGGRLNGGFAGDPGPCGTPQSTPPTTSITRPMSYT